jgi:penicillin-binding protein 2
MPDNPFKIQEGSVSDAKIPNYRLDRNSGDYVDFDTNSNSRHVGRFFSYKKIFVLSLVFAGVLFVLLGRAFYLQIAKGEHYRDIAEGNRIRSEVIKANRGLIYDRFGNLLVKNISYFFLYITPELMPEDSDLFVANIAEIIELEPEELQARLNKQSKTEKILVYENLPYEQAIKLMMLSENEPSINVNYEPRRQYLSNLGLSHVLGYLGQVTEDDIKEREYRYHDRLGKDGLEFVYENILKGKDGIQQIEVDAYYRQKDVLTKIDPIDGQDLVLTIDNTAQIKLYEIMENLSSQYDKPKMAAVVMDPSDGGVLAMVSMPNFDNNIFTSILDDEEYNKVINNPDTPLLNRVVDGIYPLGSVFKLIIAPAALEEKLIDDNFRVNSTGGVQIGNSFFPDWRSGGHGWTDVYWAIADSVNTFFYSIGGGNNEFLSLGLGVDRIIDYAKKFGLGANTNIDLASESPGFLPSKQWKQEKFDERWYLGDTYNLSIGQGFLLATPIQAAQMTSYFANNGIAYQPHFIKKIGQTEEDQVYEPKIALTNVVSSDNLNIIRQGMRMTVKSGTAKSLQSVPVSVAGKTGTAQFMRDKTPHSWFAAFAPYEDAKIVVVVLVEEGGDHGLAVSVVNRFMNWYFSQ